MKIIKNLKIEKLQQLSRGKNTAMLTNQSAWSAGTGYHFSYFKNLVQLKYLLIPEHGLFAELQDQVSGHNLEYSYDGIEAVNLYGETENSLVIPDHVLENTDILLVDIRDVGARYYTFLTTAFYLLQSVHNSGKKIPVIVIDSDNPAGSSVEGTPLQKKYESFVGVASVLHRHGMTPAELMIYYCREFSLDLELGIIERSATDDSVWVMPSPNIPTRETCLVYPGQCLLEGVNISEGRGTTRPFEIFGAPWIDPDDPKLLKAMAAIQPDSCVSRPLRFMPAFHKYSNEICGGFQIHITSENGFHSLLYTLEMLSVMRKFYPDKFVFLEGVYEFRSDRPAIELLAGDEIILDYLNGKAGLNELKECFAESEQDWLAKKNKYLS